MTIDPVMFSTDNLNWGTPIDLFNLYDAEFKFTVDVCANADNAKVARYFDEAQDGLAQSWAGEICWMNPPYGRLITPWVRKASLECPDCTVVALLPARTDTRWWHGYVAPFAKRLDFLKGRVQFIGGATGAPFPSVAVVYGKPDVKVVWRDWKGEMHDTHD